MHVYDLTMHNLHSVYCTVILTHCQIRIVNWSPRFTVNHLDQLLARVDQEVTFDALLICWCCLFASLELILSRV